jgi:hypothetical protein
MIKRYRLFAAIGAAGFNALRLEASGVIGQRSVLGDSQAKRNIIGLEFGLYENSTR